MANVEIDGANSIVYTDKVDPKTGTALELGTSGDTVTVPTGAGLTVTDEVKTNKVSPATGVALAIGDSGDTITVPSGATLDISASTLTPPATMPASSGINFTALNATNLGSGTVPAVRLGTGTASSSTVLYGDQTYKTEPVTDLTPIRRDINILALRTMIADNAATQGLVNSYMDSFEDNSGIATETQVGWNANDEAFSTIVIVGASGWFLNGYRFWEGTQSTVTTGDFTIEFWYKYISRGGADRLFCLGNPMSGGHGFSSGYNASTTWNVWGGSPALNWNVSVSEEDTDWHHHAITRDAGTNIKLWEDGALMGTSTSSNYYDMNITGAFYFGRRINSSGEYYRGYLDSIRLSNNIRYTGTFTPNTTAFVDDVNTVFIYEFDTYPIVTSEPPIDMSGNGHTVTLDTTGGAGYPLRTPTAYKTYNQTNYTSGTLISDTVATVVDARTKVSGVILYKNKFGTGSLGTDLKIYFSCDNGSNYTESTLTATQDFSSGVLMAKCSEVTCTSGTQIKWKAEWANQEVDVKETQLYSIGVNF